MNTTANADAMTAILRQISLDWNRTISYGRSYIAIFFAYVPGFTCLMAATGSTLDSVAGAAIGGAASGFLMLNITLFSYEQMNNHHWMNGIVPINATTRSSDDSHSLSPAIWWRDWKWPSASPAPAPSCTSQLK